MDELRRNGSLDGEMKRHKTEAEIALKDGLNVKGLVVVGWIYLRDVGRKGPVETANVLRWEPARKPHRSDGCVNNGIITKPFLS